MAGQVQAKGVLFALQALLQGQLAHLAVVGVNISIHCVEHAAKQVDVATVSGVGGLLGRFDGLAQRREQSGTVYIDVGLVGFDFVMEMRAEAVQCTAADQRVEGTLVDPLEVDAFTEIEQVFERAALSAGFDNRLHRALANPLIAPRP